VLLHVLRCIDTWLDVGANRGIAPLVHSSFYRHGAQIQIGISPPQTSRQNWGLYVFSLMLHFQITVVGKGAVTGKGVVGSSVAGCGGGGVVVGTVVCGGEMENGSRTRTTSTHRNKAKIIGPLSPISDPNRKTHKKSRQTVELNFVLRSCRILHASSQKIRTCVELNFVMEIA